MRILWLAIILAGFSSCRSGTSDKLKTVNNPDGIKAVTDSLEYARGFVINKTRDYKLLTVSNPWQNASGCALPL